ncbi:MULTISPECIES: Uma2 family endonuclease [Streptomyces]|uniref:Uma2 family endonuclease n=1 Tax=Streptomyces caniscabiei TaxID=2746961 RepID=A0ABU4MSR8_9ACTN|nr:MULTISPECIES: Uma2 family endonuclease [Streptomyces]MDX2943827.1 Uma2 family endonuclease [Streptomyces caniscabiei]MDX2950726.1 Uma2 family endonuclease [Streptomyces caniscabiei]MDX2986831.1 Uma2 family endonuclease [Streptomyces caniscabiei]MDX3010115.1 Uma2 family endonuclease [Streptomyces caniscabiei]MDX3040132.1 Uma2 family endonuclease [Streptomyces caniscabiei]
MTPDTAEHPQMSVEDFEELVRRAPRELRNRLEFLGGRLCVRHGPLDVDEFEELAAVAPETVRLEYINGEVEVKAMPDGNHRSIFMWLLRQCMQHRPDLDLVPESGVKAEAYRKGRARTDGTLVPVDHFRGDGEWSSPDGALMAVEITSHDRDTDRRDRVDKPLGYAAAGIPIYLLIDRDHNTVTVFSEPKDGRYRQTETHAWGVTVEIPAPVSITLDTEKLKDYAD